MLVAVSPYHLTTREAPAMAALLLAERVLTLLPTPSGSETARSAHAAAGRIPSYLAFMNTWTWTVPLWKAGVILSELDGHSPVAEMQAVSTQVEHDEHLAPLRRFMHAELYEDERAYLSAVAADLLKGGPDPGINVPVAAAIDRFATRHRAIVARPQPSSVVQQTEARMGERLAAIALPVLIQADADRILHAREVLADVLQPLWAGFEALADSDGAETDALESAAAAYGIAFQNRHDDIVDDAAADEVRLVEGAVTISALRLPTNAVLRSSVAAVEHLSRAPASIPAIEGTLPALRDPLAGRSFLSLLIKPLGARPAPRR